MQSVNFVIAARDVLLVLLLKLQDDYFQLPRFLLIPNQVKSLKEQLCSTCRL